MAENDFSISDARTIAGDGEGTPPTEDGTPMDRSIGDEPTMRPKEECGGRGAFAPGDVIAGRYVVEKVLGEGGMGIVYQCLDKVGGVKVLDFGLAAQIRSSQSRTSAAMTSRGGTPGYKSPEQWRGKPQREPADVYSFGVMAYWMFAGALPFDGDDSVVLGHAVLTEPVALIAGLPAHANAALAKALAKEPQHRFASCGAVVDALEGKDLSRVARRPRFARECK